MSDRRHPWRVVGMFVLCGVLPIIAARLIDISLPQSRWVQVPLHSAMEALGSFAALCLSALLLRSPEKGSSGRVWSASALLGMGILDAFHSAVSPGGTFVWLRSTATLLGGLSFAMVWMPERVAVSRAARVLPGAVAVGASTFGVVSVSLPGILPAMVIGGSFTSNAYALNLLGGLFFLVAAARFLTRPREGGSSSDALFASLCLLFASAALSFRFSQLWDAAWWFWHLLRLTAFLIILGHILVLYHRAGEEVRRLNRALRTLSECNQAVVRARDEAQLRNEVCRILVEEGGYRFAWVGYAEQDEAKTVRPVARAGFEAGYLDTLNITWADAERGRGPTGTAIRTRQPHVARNILTDANFAPWRVEAAKRGYGSVTGLPLVFQEQAFGALTLYAVEPDAFDAQEIKLLGELSNDLAYGIQVLRARTERARAVEESHLLQTIAFAVSQAEHFHSALDAMVRRVCEVTGWVYAETWLPRPDGMALAYGSGWHAGSADLDAFRAASEGFVFPPGVGLPGRVWSAKKPVWIQDVTLDGGFLRAAVARQAGLKAAIGVPILADDEVVAVLNFFAREVRAEDEKMISLIATVASQLGTVVRRKQAEEQIRRLNAELEQRVTERTAELVRVNKELEAFTSSVSHDLRAPLRHVDGFSKLLLEEYGGQVPEEARRYLNRVREGTRRMGTLVDDLLGLSRLGRRDLSLRLTGLGSLVAEVRGELAADTGGRQVEWQVGPLPFVECDPALMKQVFANLLSNALKFTRARERAVIEVGSLTQDGQPVIFVRDNGVGFSMKYADKLFGVFQRLHRPEDFEGTGVGLATVQRIIQKHGGKVWAEAELNKGATFYVTLGAPPAGATPEAAISGGRSCQPPR